MSRSTDKDARIDAIVVDGVRYESEDQAVYGTGVTTEDHRYWNATDQAWQESQHLDRGDLLMTLDGVIVSVEGLDWSNAHTALAYDLNIAGIDTFYVGVGGVSVLVHNVDECEFIDLVRPDRREHILTGQVGTAADGSTFYSGVHRAGTGFPGKTEFPSWWSDDQTIHYISDVATDPGSRVLVNGPHDTVVRGWRANVEIEVLIRNDEIWTAYPVNTRMN